MNEHQMRLAEKRKIKYSYGPYSKCNNKEQWIRISEGCPNDCPFCYEPTKIKLFPIPEIVRNDVKIMDMNLLCKKEALQIIQDLGEKRVNDKVVYYDLICGIDFRFLTSEISLALKKNRFKKIRLAWDWDMKGQYKMKDAVTMLKKARYKAHELMVFMVCNWKIPYEECCKKLDLLKVWGVQVADCYYDNQSFPNVIPLHWTDKQNKSFRKQCRKHNHLVLFKIDPDIKNDETK